MKKKKAKISCSKLIAYDCSPVNHPHTYTKTAHKTCLFSAKYMANFGEYKCTADYNEFNQHISQSENVILLLRMKKRKKKEEEKKQSSNKCLIKAHRITTETTGIFYISNENIYLLFVVAVILFSA